MIDCEVCCHNAHANFNQAKEKNSAVFAIMQFICAGKSVKVLSHGNIFFNLER